MAAMLFNTDRHEPLVPDDWDEATARRMIEQIVDDTEARFSPELFWPTHPNDSPHRAPSYMLYWGACGVLRWQHKITRICLLSRWLRSCSRHAGSIIPRCSR